MNYLIHTVPSRLWYVKLYLIPSMIEQGIPEESIHVWCDSYKIGNLQATMSSFHEMTEAGGTWHLCDDVIICRDFKRLTEEHDHGVVCGFCCDKFSKNPVAGITQPSGMWYSFPCIRIPNYLAYECAEWFFTTDVRADLRYLNRDDDLFFRYFLETHYPNVSVLNLDPNLVDHIDYLIGGTLVNPDREAKITRAAFFKDADLVDELERRIKPNVRT